MAIYQKIFSLQVTSPLLQKYKNDFQILPEQVHEGSKTYGMEIRVPETKAIIFSLEDQTRRYNQWTGKAIQVPRSNIDTILMTSQGR